MILQTYPQVLKSPLYFISSRNIYKNPSQFLFFFLLFILRLLGGFQSIENYRNLYMYIETYTRENLLPGASTWPTGLVEIKPKPNEPISRFYSLQLLSNSFLFLMNKRNSTKSESIRVNWMSYLYTIAISEVRSKEIYICYTILWIDIECNVYGW
jgi:hypothetical protein